MKILVEIEGPDVFDEGKNDCFEVRGVKWVDKKEKPWNRKSIEDKTNIKGMTGVNIHMMWAESSPGYWCVVDRRLCWCP